MALVACKQCGGKISSRAAACPKCGTATGAGAPAQKPTQPAARPQAAQPKAAPAREPEKPAAATAASVPPAPERAPAADRELPAAEAWYYVSSAGRQGPVPLERIRSLAASGAIPAETPVWKAGLPDWVVLSAYRESPVEPTVEESTETAVTAPGNYLLWALALAPLWGGIVQIVATETTVSLARKKLAYYGEFWWITVLINVLVCYVDFYRARKAGAEVGQAETWLCLAVPAYLYRRDRALSARLPRFWVWIASLVVTLALIIYLNGVYAKISIK